ncbi:histidine-type phosphatase [Rosenbergiella epipactidis]|uniref:histidine-type phosphatase n=1 Tax=Rosenbergiella epipactidis TaxID=1544694 RepID=UPI001F4E2251|nr:histidine-type phosphatase [Rosenbergiella epipactidis]
MPCSLIKNALLIGCIGLLGYTSLSDAASRFILDKVVVVARHGVRSPTDDHDYTALTGQHWPKWSVPAGHLTGHGYAGMVQQGKFFAEQWQHWGLTLPFHQGCPARQSVSVWTAPDQRTQATGSALLDGLFPGCGIPIAHTQATADPLFDASKMTLTPPNTVLILDQIQARMAAKAPLTEHYRAAVALFRQAVCAPLSASCAFLDNPWDVTFTDNGQPKLVGPVAHAASMAETIRLAYSENLPLSEVAFGHVRQAKDVGALMALHAAKYDLVSDTPEYARQGGSLLMTQILDALTDDTSRYASRLASPIVLFVGHDTNIAQLQTMLGFNWQLAEYPCNDIPPGGSLVFLRFHDATTGKQFIQLSFMTRSLDQWRALTPLSLQVPMLEADNFQKGCFRNDDKTLCPLSPFVRQARQQIKVQDKSFSLFQ